MPPEVPERKEFETLKFDDTIEKLRKNTPLKEIEAACIPIAKYILKNEGFTKMIKGPDFKGTPFDLFGFKNRSV